MQNMTAMSKDAAHDAWSSAALASDNGHHEMDDHIMETFAPLRAGDWMQTYTGQKFWPMDPRAEDVFIDDIAHSLSMQCRYAGHCLLFYSVAEHSVLIADYLRIHHGPEVAMYGLLHDASEAYLVDVPRPVKPYLDGYKTAEALVQGCVWEAFCLPQSVPVIVKQADDRIITDERCNLVDMQWETPTLESLGVTLKCWDPATAEREFLDTFYALEAAL